MDGNFGKFTFYASVCVVWDGHEVRIGKSVCWVPERLCEEFICVPLDLNLYCVRTKGRIGKMDDLYK